MLSPSSASFAAVLIIAFAIEAEAKPTAQQKCQGGKNIAAGKLAACLQNAEAKLTTTGDAAKYAKAKLDCSYKFAKSWLKLEAAAARAGTTCPDAPLDQEALEAAIRQCSTSVASALAGGGLADCTASLSMCLDDLGTSQAAHTNCEMNLDSAESNLANCQAALATCSIVTPTPTPTPTPTTSPTPTTTPIPRFMDNGNGTVTDNETGLMWEKKTTSVGSGMNLADPHDVDNVYTWNENLQPPYLANGTAFTDFLVKLNTAPCFAGHCDWRLPSEAGRNEPFTGARELESILIESYPCGSRSLCIDPIFGPTAADSYYSATTSATSSFQAWFVHFGAGAVGTNTKGGGYFRAVRAGP